MLKQKTNKSRKETLHLEVNGKQYPLKVIYENRRAGRASICNSGIIIRIPVFLSDSETEQTISHLTNWAVAQLKKKPQLFKEHFRPAYTDGQILTVQGHPFQLHIRKENRKSASSRLSLKDLQVFLSIPEECETEEKTNTLCSRLISGLMCRAFLPAITRRVHHLNQEHFNKNILQVRLTTAQSRWGSCSSKGTISISARLLLAPTPVLDYVIIHELAHLLEHNHSSRFWLLVKNAMPDFKEKEKWLRQNGHLCQF